MANKCYGQLTEADRDRKMACVMDYNLVRIKYEMKPPLMNWC